MSSIEQPKENGVRVIPFTGRVDEDWQRISIRTQHTQYRGTYFYEPEMRVAKGTWLGHLCRLLSAASETKALPDGPIRALGQGIQLLQAPPLIEAAWAPDASTLDPRDVHDLFEHLESRLKASKFTAKLRYAISVAFRRTCLKNLSRLGASRVSESSVRFRTRLVVRSTPRSLISDFSTADLPPIGATPHENIRELQAKVHERVHKDILKIREAALAELNAGQRLRDHLEEAGRCASSIPVLEEVLQACTRNHRGNTIYGPRFQNNQYQYLGALVVVHEACSLGSADARGAWGVARGRELDHLALTAVGWNAPVRRVIRLRNEASGQELFAAALLVQTATAWNISSVLALRREDVERKGDGFLIQSYKGKTDDYTPPVGVAAGRVADEEPGKSSADGDTLPESEIEIAADDDFGEATIRALKLLIWHHEQMIALGFKCDHETSLFLGGGSRRGSQTLTVNYFLRDFRRRYQLPKFSCEQIRTQVLFAESMGGVEPVRRLAGHASMRTTGDYIHQEIAHRLHSSINLEMQRRLEAEVRTLMQAEVDPLKVILLRPLGDGASCVDPTQPPWGSLGKETCAAVHCHEQGGCANRRLIVNDDRIREAVITRRAYEASWQRLLARNKHAFLQFDLPRILFNEAFLRVLAGGRYAHRLNKITQEVANEQN